MGKLIDLTGRRFGRLVVAERAENSFSGEVQWLCECDCGMSAIVTRKNLLREHTKSCGCLKAEGHYNGKHYQTNSRLYHIWRAIKSRTANQKDSNYKLYGERGIKICNEWDNDFESFMLWALSNGYQENLTIDRIDNDKGYSPANCRWVSVQEQNRNKRDTILIEYMATVKPLVEWAEILGIRYDTLRYRIKKGWCIEKAFTTPVKKH